MGGHRKAEAGARRLQALPLPATVGAAPDAAVVLAPEHVGRGGAGGDAVRVLRGAVAGLLGRHVAGLQAGGAQLAGLLAAAAAGLVLAGVTAWLMARGARHLTYRTLFRVSEILLLLVAGTMLANGIDRMIALDWLPPIIDTVWDTSGLVDDAGGIGRLLAGFVGYRARPSGVLLLAAGLYWAFAVWQLKRGSRHGG